MANVNIKFNGKEFLLSCDDGQEEHLEELLTHINEKFNNLMKLTQELWEPLPSDGKLEIGEIEKQENKEIHIVHKIFH